jgi:hypothetical protein
LSNDTSRACIIQIAMAAAISIGAGSPAHGQQLQSFSDCTAGKRVSTNRDGRKGVITHVDTAWSYCYVRFDDDGKEASFLYSLLNSEDGLAPKDPRLTAGVYECVSYGQNNREKTNGVTDVSGGRSVTSGKMRITGPDTYSSERHPGSFGLKPRAKLCSKRAL